MRNLFAPLQPLNQGPHPISTRRSIDMTKVEGNRTRPRPAQVRGTVII